MKFICKMTQSWLVVKTFSLHRALYFMFTVKSFPSQYNFVQFIDLKKNPSNSKKSVNPIHNNILQRNHKCPAGEIKYSGLLVQIFIHTHIVAIRAA